VSRAERTPGLYGTREHRPPKSFCDSSGFVAPRTPNGPLRVATSINQRYFTLHTAQRTMGRSSRHKAGTGPAGSLMRPVRPDLRWAGGCRRLPRRGGRDWEPQVWCEPIWGGKSQCIPRTLPNCCQVASQIQAEVYAETYGASFALQVLRRLHTRYAINAICLSSLGTTISIGAIKMKYLGETYFCTCCPTFRAS